MKCIVGIGKQIPVNYNWGCACTNGIVLVDIFILGAIAVGGIMIHLSFCNLSFAKRTFGWMDAWELNPEGLGLL
jgi:hypothetical protein